LTAAARRWLLRDSPQSIRDYLLYNALQWNWLSRTDGYLQTGTPIRFHQEMSPDEWKMYQHAMLAIARLTAPDVARRIPVPSTARQMLDIGGAHGAYSLALCQRHPQLQATILDLPQAVKFAAALLARSGMCDRVRHITGDALTTDLGEARYDLIFMANLVHHF